MSLSDHEIDRYARHLMLKEIGGPGQNRLKNSKVLIVGAGGLGCPAALYLAAAGVGHIGIVDDDHVSLSNLQRQILFSTSDIGKPKTEVAARHLEALNPAITLTPYVLRIEDDNSAALLTSYDLVLDGSDNFRTRYRVSDACFHARIPLISGWLGPTDGGLTTLRPFEISASGDPNPTYRCLFPEPPSDESALPCAMSGVLGPLAGMVGTMMALEAMREIVPFGEGLTGVFLKINALTLETKRLRYGWDRENPLSGSLSVPL